MMAHIEKTFTSSRNTSRPRLCHESEDTCDIRQEYYCPELLLTPRRPGRQNLPSMHQALQASRSQGKRKLPLTRERLEMMKVETRLRTFQNDWQGPSPSDMADAGFYWLKDRRAVCAYCLVEIRNWGQGDRVWERHVIWSPCCRYLRYTLDASCYPVPPKRRRGSYSAYEDLTSPM